MNCHKCGAFATTTIRVSGIGTWDFCQACYENKTAPTENIKSIQQHQLNQCIEKIQSSKNVMDQCLAYIAKDDSAQAKYLWEIIQKYLYDRE